MIKPISVNYHSSNVFAFKRESSQSENSKRLVYVDKETQNLQDLALGVTILALIANQPWSSELHSGGKINKVALIFSSIALGLMAVLCGKKIKLNKEYNENGGVK